MKNFNCRILFGFVRGLFGFVAIFSPDSAFSKQYPDSFLWGAAFSAYQTEGLSGGGENGDWHRFTHPAPGVKNPIENGDNADVAVDHWNRFVEDYDNGAKLGLRTLRTSVAWEKIEPVPGQFNQASLKHYHEMFSAMKSRGLRPMIAFHHFTHPQWFQDKGGWLNPESPKWFLNYATQVFDALKDDCDLWITFNEPMMLTQMGYLQGIVPPLKATVEDAFEAAYNMVRAHRMVVAMIHERQGIPNVKDPQNQLKGVGIAYAFSYFEPADPKNHKDQMAVDKMMELTNWSWLKAAETGVLEFAIPAEVYPKKLYRVLPVEDLKAGAEPKMDWLGANYYSRWLLRYNPLSKIRVDWVTAPGPKGDNGWPVYPKGLENLLLQIGKRFSVPIVVTENGMADATDKLRPQAIKDHLLAMDRAADAGVDLRGYYHWSLVDNFEWLSGYKYKFGLIGIDFKNNLKRVFRSSATVYKNEIAARGLSVKPLDNVPAKNGDRDSIILVLWDANQPDVKIRSYLENVRRAGTNHVVVPFLGCQTDRYSSDVGVCEPLPEAFAIQQARLAKELGMTVSFLPIVLSISGEWRGFFDPKDVDLWFKNYGIWIKKIARISSEMQMPNLVVGTEFSRLYKYESNWKKLISEIRNEGVFKGALVLTANWDDVQHNFWDAPDAIGVSAYYPLSAKTEPTDAELAQGMKKEFDLLMGLAKKWKKPLHFTEVGYMSNAYAANPHSVPALDKVTSNVALQARCYQVFSDRWVSEPTLSHVGVWATSDPADQYYSVGWDTIGKPAEKVLLNFFKARNQASY